MFEAKFQTFDDKADPAASAPRLVALRTELARRGLTGFVVPHADRHQSEYLPPSEERLAWLTGFTGSAGSAIVLIGRATLFVDGRYTLQAREQVDTTLFDIENIVDTTPEQWIERTLAKDDTLGYDPWLHTVEGAEKFATACTNAGATLIAIEPNLIDEIWSDRPAPPLGAVSLHDIRYAGEAAETKLSKIRAEIAKLKSDALVVSDPHAVAWTFNIRGSDVAHTPLPLSFAIVPREGRPSLFIDGRKLSNDVRHRLEALADVREPDAFAGALTALGAAGSAVRLDPAHRRRRAGAPHQERRRQGDQRPRPDRAAQGGQEFDRDRRRSRSAPARRRGGDALPRLVRPRGAERQGHRNRRGGERSKPSAARPVRSRTSRSRRFPAPGRTAPSCTIASPARATARSP